MSIHLNKMVAVVVAAVIVLCAPSILTVLGLFITMGLAVWLAEDEGATKVLIQDQPVLITGCDTGFGYLLVGHLNNLGAVVYAGCLDAEGEGPLKLRLLGPNVHVLQMDVTSDKQVADVHKYVMENEKHKGLWGVVNNAGVNFNGDVELTTMEQFEKVTLINYLGAVRVTKTFLPLIRQSQGHIVNVTSVKACFSCPYISTYGATKHALRAFSDCLRMEMSKWNVKVSLIEPGNFGGATKAIDMGRMRTDYEAMWKDLSPEQQEDYGRGYIDAHLARLEAAVPSASFNLEPVLQAFTDALFDLNPEIRYIVPGCSKSYDIYKWIVLAVPYVPTALMDRYLIWRTAGLVPDAIKNM